jgi:hypothetical protein
MSDSATAFASNAGVIGLWHFDFWNRLQRLGVIFRRRARLCQGLFKRQLRIVGMSLHGAEDTWGGALGYPRGLGILVQVEG